MDVNPLYAFYTGGRRATVDNADAAFGTSLARLLADARSSGYNVTIGNSWRSYSEQAGLVTKNSGSGVPTATPGRSRHEIGVAADLVYSSTAAKQWIHQNASRYGMNFPVGGEDWHVQLAAGQPAYRTMAGQRTPYGPGGSRDATTFGNPIQNSNAGNIFGDQYASSYSGAAVADTSGNAVGTGGFDGTVPKDMKMVVIGGVFPVVAYELTPGVWAYFDGPQVAQVSGNLPVWEVSAEAWKALRITRVGDVSELDDIAREYEGGFGEFFTETMYLAGIPREAAGDPGIAQVLAEFAARPDMSPQEISRRLAETDWYQKRNETQRAWNDLGAADKRAAIDASAAQIMDAVFRYGGQNAGFGDPEIQQWAEQVASGQTSLTTLINSVIKPLAEGNPDSPWSRTLRDEGRAQRQAGADYENEASRVRSQAYRWGVQLSDAEALEWGRKITENVMSTDDFTEYLKDVAQGLFPWKSREQETQSAAQPYLQTYGSTFDVGDADMFTPEILSAMQRGLTVTDFKRELMATDRWETTQEAKTMLSSMGGTVGKLLGME